MEQDVEISRLSIGNSASIITEDSIKPDDLVRSRAATQNEVRLSEGVSGRLSERLFERLPERLSVKKSSEVTVIQELMNNTQNIRNVSVIGEINHGKSTLLDSLLSSTGSSVTSVISTSINIGMTMKMTPTAAYATFDTESFKSIIYNNEMLLSSTNAMLNSSSTEQSYLITLLDTPGQADLSGEASVALRLSDGAIVVIDTNRGYGAHTETLLKLALSERVKPVLFINKLDQALIDLQLDAEVIYQSLYKIIRKSNIFVSSLKLNGQESWAPDPIQGSVVFGSASQKWAFSLDFFARFYAAKFKTTVAIMRSKLWGNWCFSPSADGLVQWVESDTMDTNNGTDIATGSKRAFSVFILNPILGMCMAVLNNELSKSGTPKAFLMMKSVGVKLSEDEKTQLKGRPLLELILQRWLSLSDTMIELMTVHLPSPVTAQTYRVESLYNGSLNDETAMAIRSCANMSDNSTPLTMYISKMIHIEGEKFTAFGRVFSGTVSTNQTVRILGKHYNPNDAKSKDLFINPIGELIIFTSQNQSLSVGSVPVGNICGVTGIDAYILKSGTITSSEMSNCLRDMKFSSAPVLKIAINAMNPKSTPLLLEGFKRLSKSNPTLVCKTTDYGENLIYAGGEFHLDSSLEALKTTFASDVEFITGTVHFPYHETILTASSQVATSKSPNQHNRLFCFAEPLSTDVISLFDDQVINPSLSSESKSQILQRHSAFKYGWEVEVASPDRLWCFGAEIAGANVLSCQYNGPNNLDEVKASIQAGFRFSCEEGPLCDEPLRGLKLNLTNVSLHADAIHRGMGQMLPTARRVTFAAMCLSTPSLMESIFLVTIICPCNRVSQVIELLAARRGTVLDEGKNLSAMAAMKVHIPVSESLGFANELAEMTDNCATCQMSFDHWKNITGDYKDPDGRLNKLIQTIRTFKGLRPGVPALDEYFDKV